MENIFLRQRKEKKEIVAVLRNGNQHLCVLMKYYIRSYNNIENNFVIKNIFI